MSCSDPAEIERLVLKELNQRESFNKDHKRVEKFYTSSLFKWESIMKLAKLKMVIDEANEL